MILLEPDSEVARTLAAMCERRGATTRHVASMSMLQAMLEPGPDDNTVVLGPGLAGEELAAAVHEVVTRAPDTTVVALASGSLPLPHRRLDGLDMLVLYDGDGLPAEVFEATRALRSVDHVTLVEAACVDAKTDSYLNEVCAVLAYGFDVSACFQLSTSGSVLSALPDLEDVTSSGVDLSALAMTAAHTGTTVLARTGAAGAAEPQWLSVAASPFAFTAGSDAETSLALVARGPRRFSSSDLRMLSALSERVSGALGEKTLIEHIRGDYESLKEGPSIDTTLDIWNQAGLVQLTEMRLSETRRSRTRLPVAVIDVSGMHDINRRYGHKNGDRLLKHIALMTVTSLRGCDIVGRFGGAKIAATLPGADMETARRALERVMASLAERPFLLPSGEEIPVRVSYGISECAIDATRPHEALLEAANAARRALKQGSTGEITVPTTSLTFLDTADSGAVLAGTYRLRYEISRGGVGVVYRAEDIRLDRAVAVKMLHSELVTDEAIVELFNAEAAILATLKHPNLVDVFASGCEDGTYYFVMELVEGESVQDTIDRLIQIDATLPLARVRDVVRQIGSALDALHEREVFHCDVKPANIVLDPFRERAVLVDVGIARRHGDEALPAGTPGYMAPEIFSGATPSAKTDVFGLAATVFAMLTNRDPWNREQSLPALITEQFTGPSPLVAPDRPDLGPLDDVLTRALSPRPDERPETAGEFARQLIDVLEPLIPTPAPRTTAEYEIVTASDVDEEQGSEHLTRGLVFRSVARVLGARGTHRLVASLVGESPDMASALSPDTTPLVWIPTDLFQLVLREPAILESRKDFPRQLGRATVRSSFRRLFPASAATLSPGQTLAAIPSIWSAYQTWGQVTTLPQRATQATVRIKHTLRDKFVCEWTAGLLEQLVLLSRGREPRVTHDSCEARGDSSCMFAVTWSDLD